jgi:prolyl 4-hydroxylase
MLDALTDAARKDTDSTNDTRRSLRRCISASARRPPTTLSARDPYVGCRFPKRAVFLHQDPKLVLVPQFLTKTELARLLASADSHRAVFQRSQVDTHQNTTLNVPYRTSRSAALPEDSVVRRVIRRAADILHVFPSQFESPQLVRYEAGQEFKTHHDAATLMFLDPEPEPQHRDDEHETVCRPFVLQISPLLPKRLWTCLIYLTSQQGEDQGGETIFPLLDISVRPQAGAALFWNNFTAPEQPHRPDRPDPRVVHGGQRLSRGLKLAINLWVSP